MSFLYGCCSLKKSHLEELVLGHNPQDALRLVLVGLGVELPGSGEGAVRDDKASLSPIVLHLDVVEPVRVALDDLDVVEVPGDVRLFYVNLWIWQDRSEKF